MAGPEDPRLPAEDDLVSFTLRRSHMYAVVGLLAGFVAGYFTHQRMGRGPGGPAEAQQAPAAVLDAAGQPITPGRVVQVATDGRPSRGPTLARVTIVEFTDYLCPFCRQHAQANLPAVLRRYGDRVRYVVRNYPIAQLHPRAVYSATAAECAYDQGKFWEYHDRLFATENHDDATLKAIARDLRLDTRRFNRCLDNGETVARVDQDIRDGNTAGVTGTPTLYVNGRPVEGYVPLETFVQIIDDELRKAAN